MIKSVEKSTKNRSTEYRFLKYIYCYCKNNERLDKKKLTPINQSKYGYISFFS